jgi:hypothetical protein
MQLLQAVSSLAGYLAHIQGLHERIEAKEFTWGLAPSEVWIQTIFKPFTMLSKGAAENDTYDTRFGRLRTSVKIILQTEKLGDLYDILVRYFECLLFQLDYHSDWPSDYF